MERLCLNYLRRKGKQHERKNSCRVCQPGRIDQRRGRSHRADALGAQVEVRPVQDVHDLTPYGAVIAGSAIQRKQWLPEAMDFVRTNRAALAQKPFAAFQVCMTLAMPNQQYHFIAAEWMRPVSDLVKPRSQGLFAGALDISKVPGWLDRLKFRVSVAFGVWTEGDHRDWQAIRSRAASLIPLLRTD